MIFENDIGSLAKELSTPESYKINMKITINNNGRTNEKNLTYV